MPQTLSDVKRDLTLTRTFDVPRELLFKAWIDTDMMKRWWGPRGFTNPVCNLDVWPGGAIRIDMRAPDGVVYPMSGIFNEIVAPERLVFTSFALDHDRNPLFEILNTVTISEANGQATLHLQVKVVHETSEAPQYLAGMEEGWTQSLERLSALIASLT